MVKVGSGGQWWMVMEGSGGQWKAIAVNLSLAAPEEFLNTSVQYLTYRSSPWAQSLPLTQPSAGPSPCGSPQLALPLCTARRQLVR